MRGEFPSFSLFPSHHSPRRLDSELVPNKALELLVCPWVVARWNHSEGGDRGGLETRVALAIFGS